MIERVQGDQRRDEAPGHRANNPETHGRGPAELGTEVAHQGRRGHQDRPLHNADHPGDDGVRPFTLAERDADGGGGAPRSAARR